MYYICKGKKILGTCDGFPNTEDLQSRGEFLIKDNRSLDIMSYIVDNGKLLKIKKEVKNMDSKKWYLSKTVWSGIISVIIVAYNATSITFGVPAIPEYVFGILAALGIYSRVNATTVIK